MSISKNHLIFGGNGFIGTHLVNYLLSLNIPQECIQVVDFKRNELIGKQYHLVDVRLPIILPSFFNDDTTIYNFAAIHKSPGHPDEAYFETNVSGATNICNYARENNISTIVFTSSIAIYGTAEHLVDENSLALPNTAYGTSKLTAEHIHKTWQAEMPTLRRLIILRPGAVFGHKEMGNFSRLYNSLKKGFFIYPGRKDTIKSIVYIKDVVRIITETAYKEPYSIFTVNLSYFPAPTIECICKLISQITGVKMPKILIPSFLIKVIGRILHSALKIIYSNNNTFHPVRIKKLMVSTNISGEKLFNSQYKLRYNLKEAIVDWWNDCEKNNLS